MSLMDQAKMMKDAYSMKRKMDKIQKQLAKQEMVIGYQSISVTITGDQTVKRIDIAPEALNADNKKNLEAELKNAMNKAIAESQQIMQKEMQSIAGDLNLNLPGMG